MSNDNQFSQQCANRFSRGFLKIGRSKILAGLLGLAALNATAQSNNVVLAWNASADSTVTGYNLYYGEASGAYTASINAGSNLTATITGLTPGLTYYFAVLDHNARGLQSKFSNEVTNRIPVLPSITTQPLAQKDAAGSSANLTVSAVGSAPLSFQWMDGGARLPGATASVLSWAKIASSNAGNYTVIVSNPWGSVTSAVAAVTVLTAPSITQQPQSQTVVATTPGSFSTVVAGSAPLSIQWYFGSNLLPGATSSSLSWKSVATSNGGNYKFTVSNAVGMVTSSVVTLTVYASNTFAPVAGVYNGLFFQTNAGLAPAMTEASSGLFGNCLVASNGGFSAKVYVGGVSYSMSGNFNVSGKYNAFIPLPAGGASTLQAILQLGLTNGTTEITGSISNTAAGNTWNAPLVAAAATNANPGFSGVTLVISPGLNTNAPTNLGVASGVVVNGVLSLAGVLGDSLAFSQTVPICQDGYAPIYVSLYNNSGLLEGWLNLSGEAATGSLTWIRPSGVLSPAGYPTGFDTTVTVAGTTSGN